MVVLNFLLFENFVDSFFNGDEFTGDIKSELGSVSVLGFFIELVWEGGEPFLFEPLLCVGELLDFEKKENKELCFNFAADEFAEEPADLLPVVFFVGVMVLDGILKRKKCTSKLLKQNNLFLFMNFYLILPLTCKNRIFLNTGSLIILKSFMELLEYENDSSVNRN